MTRKLYGWERDGKFYLSVFGGAKVHANGTTPTAEFDSKEALEAEVNRRNKHPSGLPLDAMGLAPSIDLVWEYLPDGH